MDVRAARSCRSRATAAPSDAYATMGLLRRRDPPPPKAVCVRCGWSGTPNHQILRDDHGDASLVLSQKPCPVCGTKTVQLGEQKPPLPIQIVTAVRAADLTSAQLLEIVEVARRAPSDVSPRELSDQVPVASKIITIASRSGEGWIGLLAIVLTAIAMYVAHMDSRQAHRDAEEAIERSHEDAERALRNRQEDAGEPAPTTKGLSDEDIRKLARQIEADLKGSEGSQPRPR